MTAGAAARLRAAIEAGLADDTHATLQAIVGALRTAAEVADDLDDDGLVREIKAAIDAIECIEVAVEGSDDAPTAKPTPIGQPFCACGRVVSDCDGSRMGCPQ